MVVEAREDSVRLFGDLRDNQWPNLKAVANLLLQRQSAGIIIDCKHLKEVTSEGADTFLDAVRYIEANKARIVVAGLPPNVLATLRDVPGLRSGLPVASTVDEARRSLQLDGTAEAPSAVASETALLVPVLKKDTALHGTQTACRLGNDSKSEIHLAYMLSVPRNLPLQTPQPELEQEADSLLTECEAVVKGFGLKSVRHLQRTRDPGEGILTLIETLNIKTLVLSRSGSGGSDDPFTDAVLNRAQCEVIISQLPSQSQA